MADWPDLDELKLVLDVESANTDHDETLQRNLDSAISKVKLDVGTWVEADDEPDDALAAAALRMAELLSLRPGAQPDSHDMDPTYQRNIYGHRRAFGIA